MGFKKRVAPKFTEPPRATRAEIMRVPHVVKALAANPDLQETINLAWDALKEVAEGVVPRDKRRNLLTDLDDYPVLNNEPVIRELFGWMRGVAKAFGIKPEQLIEHVTEEWRP